MDTDNRGMENNQGDIRLPVNEEEYTPWCIHGHMAQWIKNGTAIYCPMCRSYLVLSMLHKPNKESNGDMNDKHH